MRAILLAAGLGTRLRPLTEVIPKCLVPIKKKPLLGIWLDRLTLAGIGPFLVNTHYLSNQVEDFVSQSIHKEQIILSHEEKLLGTAGTLISNLEFFQGQDGMLIHADNYCLADLAEFKKEHLNRPPECVMTMMTFQTDSPSSCGIVDVDQRGIVIGFHEKVANPPGNLANGAVYILSSELIRYLETDLKLMTDFSNEVLNKFIGRIKTYKTNEIFLDIGTSENYERANI
jgi:mannose-1-phosphate guanylyltransferase